MQMHTSAFGWRDELPKVELILRIAVYKMAIMDNPCDVSYHILGQIIYVMSLRHLWRPFDTFTSAKVRR